MKSPHHSSDSDTDSDSFVGPPRPPVASESKKRTHQLDKDTLNGDSDSDGDSMFGPPRPPELAQQDEQNGNRKRPKLAKKPNANDPRDEETTKLRHIRLLHMPNAPMYEKSYMHRAAITHVLCTRHTNFIVTASTDGIVKWWKKLDVGNIEFVKMVRAHASRIVDMVCSVDGTLLVTAAHSPVLGRAPDRKHQHSQQPSSIKVFDVVNFDMVNVINVEYPIARVAILDNVGHGLGDLFGNVTSIKYRGRKLVAVVECGTKTVRIYDPLHGTEATADDSATARGEGESTEEDYVKVGKDGKNVANDGGDSAASAQRWGKFRIQTDSHSARVHDEDNNDNVNPLSKAGAVVRRFSQSLAVIENLPHRTPIHLIAYNHHFDTIVTVDYDNVIEYWQFMDKDDEEKQYRAPPNPHIISFQFKTQTDLYEFAKHRAFVLSIDFNSGVDSTLFVTYSLDSKVRLFDFRTGKLLHTWDESLDQYEHMQKRGELGLENIDFGRRVAIEKEIMESQAFYAQPNNAGKTPGNTQEQREQINTSTMNVLFDTSGMFIVYATMIGIKVVNVQTKKLELLLGKVENTERFLNVALFQGTLKPTVSRQLKQRQRQQQQQQQQQQHMQGAAGGHVRLFHEPDEQQLVEMSSSDLPKHQQTRDPSLFATSYKKQRFYIFTRREPADDVGDQAQHRDIFNEKPSKEDIEVHQEMMKHALPKEAIIHTSFGDIYVRLFGDLCPKAVENFCGLAEKGYYNNMIFHRVIKKFMVQTGDPNGDGTGGTSIWGNTFGDEFHSSLRFDAPGKLAMANAGPNTNGSQFFITTAPTPWLNNKHTLFGEVIKGKDIVHAIESVKTDKQDKPIHDVKLLSIEVRK